MHIFETYTLWPAFERLYALDSSKLEMALGAKIIADRSNVVITCVASFLFPSVHSSPTPLLRPGFFAGSQYLLATNLMIYQANYVSGRVNNTSKVLVTMSLLIVTFNRLQYEGQSIDELRTRVQRTGPLLPTLRYVASEVLLAILLVLEGFKAGGGAGGIMVLILFVTLLALGSIFPINHAVQEATQPETANPIERKFSSPSLFEKLRVH
ncbi:hypothetical protein DL96DRAFT_1557314 [Flagelloscypha sp. PMI_526]|nr:hypothetical protein DL96DRAFT_1557314 [Flagelloscypha sp. PMI_526]